MKPPEIKPSPSKVWCVPGEHWQYVAGCATCKKAKKCKNYQEYLKPKLGGN